MKQKFGTYLWLASGMALGGSSVVVGKIVIGVFPVFLSQTLTLTIALAGILPLAWICEGNVFRTKLLKKDWLFLFLQALTGMFLFRVFLLYGLKLTSATEGGIITSSGPAVLSLLSLWLLKEKIKINAWIGIAVCVAGILFLNTAGSADAQDRGVLRYIGNLLVLFAVTGECLFTIFRKKLSYSDKPITSTMIIILFSLLMFLPVSLVEAASFDFSAIHAADFIPLAVYGLLCTVLAYICWFRGVAHVPVSVAAGFTGVMPVTSVLLSFLILKEAVRIQHLIGMLLVIAGIYLISFPKTAYKKQTNHSIIDT